MRPMLGPGRYSIYDKKVKSPTASFLSTKDENLFSVIEGGPGPHEYKPVKTNKFWSSSMQAFGSTERRFMQECCTS